MATSKTKAESIRNVCILAHVDHGKTSIADSLLTINGLVSKRSAGQLRFLDSRKDEQLRGITMKSSTVSLIDILTCQDGADKDTPIFLNLIDTPGHIDFSSEVTAAVRICDGALIVVDVVEGVCSQTKEAIKHSYEQKVKMILVINKIDRLILELDQEPKDMFPFILKIIEDCNAYLGFLYRCEEEDENKVENGLFFTANSGNIIFASGLDGWGFTTIQLVHLFLKHFPNETPETLNMKMWDFDCYPDFKLKQIKTGAIEKNKSNLFIQTCLTLLHQIYTTIMIRMDSVKINQIVSKLQIDCKNYGQTNDHRLKLRLIMQAFKSLPKTILLQCVKCIPSPLEIDDEKVKSLLNVEDYTNVEDKIVNEQIQMYKNCSKDAPLIGYVSKMFTVNKNVFTESNKIVYPKSHSTICNLPEVTIVALARIFSGTIRVGQTLYVSIPNLSETEMLTDVKLGNSETESLTNMKPRNVVSITETVTNSKQANAEPETSSNVSETEMLTDVKHGNSETESLTDMKPANVVSVTETVTNSKQVNAEPETSTNVSETEMLTDVKHGNSVTELLADVKPANVVSETEMLPSMKQVNTETSTSLTQTEVVSPSNVSETQMVTDVNSETETLTNMKQVKVEALYLLLGRELQSVPAVSAGFICGIGGLNCISRTGTISTMENCLPIIDKYETEPILCNIIEPNSLSDFTKLGEALELLKLSDSCVKVSLGASGQYLLHTAGEIHFEKCMEDLKKFAEMTITASEPIFPLRETVRDTFGKEIKKECVLPCGISCYISVFALPNGLCKLVESNYSLLNALAKAEEKTVTEIWLHKQNNQVSTIKEKVFKNKNVQNGVARLKQKLQMACEDLNGINANNIWSVTQTKDAINVLFSQRYERNIWNVMNESDSRSLLDKCIVNAFADFCKSGPICQEPIKNCGFLLDNLQVSDEFLKQPFLEMGILSQVTQFFQNSFKEAFNEQKERRIMEPIFATDIQVDPLCLGKVYSVVHKRFGKVVEAIGMDDRERLFVVRAEIPAVESIGFANEIRKAASGNANPTLRFSHYEVIDSDPFYEERNENEEENELQKDRTRARKLKRDVRRRKGMSVDDQVVIFAEKQRTLNKKK